MKKKKNPHQQWGVLCAKQRQVLTYLSSRCLLSMCLQCEQQPWAAAKCYCDANGHHGLFTVRVESSNFKDDTHFIAGVQARAVTRAPVHTHAHAWIQMGLLTGRHLGTWIIIILSELALFSFFRYLCVFLHTHCTNAFCSQSNISGLLMSLVCQRYFKHWPILFHRNL